MAEFKVTFQLQSYYDDSKYDLMQLLSEYFESDDLDELLDDLDDDDLINDLDDSGVINTNATDSPNEINIEYVLIHDDQGNEVYRDEDYIS